MNRHGNLRAVGANDTPTGNAINSIGEIIADVKAGKMVILVDDEARENEGDLVIAAERVTPDSINFMAKHGRGLVCLTLSEARCRRLNLPLMVADNRSPLGTNFTVSIDAAKGVTTGISAADRARTVQAAVKKGARAEDIVQPGHVFPLKAQAGGVLVRAGHTEAGCDLAALAGFEPAAVICEVLNDDGEMARLPDLIEFAHLHALKIGTIADLIHYRSQTETLIERVGERQVVTPFGAFKLIAYDDKISEETHLALTKGDIVPQLETLVRVHDPVTVMDFLDDARREHSFSVPEAMRVIGAGERGALVLLRRSGADDQLIRSFEPEWQRRKGRPKWDPRSYGIGAQILRDLGIGKMRVLAHPTRMPSVIGFDLDIVGYLLPKP